MSERAWTPEMIDELKRLRRLGRTFGQIARRLGVTRNAAIGKAMRVGLRVRVRGALPGGRAKPVTVPEPAPVGPEREVLKGGLCHWVHGDPCGAWRMCGHQSVRGRLWCAHHLARVFDSVALPSGQRQDAA